MFKYVKFTRVADEVTVYEFRGGNDDVRVNHFDVDVVSIQSDDEDAIHQLIASQDEKIVCTEISKEEFKELVDDSAQINRIRDIVKERIASKYSVADEIAMLKKSDNDAKKVEYLIFIEECKLIGINLKQNLGFESDEYSNIPESITPRQARLQLAAINKLKDVEASIDSLDADSKDIATIEWEYATVYEINHPFIDQLTTVMQIDKEQFFKDASKL